MKSDRMRCNLYKVADGSRLSTRRAETGIHVCYDNGSIVRLKGRRFITWQGKANIRTLGRNIWIDICAKVIHMLEWCKSLFVSTCLLQAPVREFLTWSINPLKNNHSKPLHSTHTVFLCVPYNSTNKQRLLYYNNNNNNVITIRLIKQYYKT